MAANQFNLGNNNNGGLLPPVGAQPVIPPLPLGNLAAPGGNNVNENLEAAVAAADAQIALGALQAAELLYPIVGAQTLERVKEYLIAQMDLAEDADLLSLSEAYGTLITLLNREPISEAGKQNLLAYLGEIRGDLEIEIKNILFNLVIEFNPVELNYRFLDLLALYKALNKLDGRPEGHLFAGDATDDEPRLSPVEANRLGIVANLLFGDLNGMLNAGDLEAEARENAQELLPVIEGAEERIGISSYPVDPSLTFLIEYLRGAADSIADETGLSHQDLQDLREKCLQVQDFRRAAAVRAAEAGNINANNANFLRRVAVNAEAAPQRADREQAALKTIEEAKAILERDGAPPNGGAPTDLGPEARGRVEQKLIKCFFENWKEMENKPTGTEKEFLQYIRKLLIDNEAVIAGGFVLKNIGGFKNAPEYEYNHKDDIDIYVPCRHLKGFNIIWGKLLKATRISQFAASLYCVSFLRKNGIRSVQKLRGAEQENICEVAEIDIMAVRNKRRVLDVVQNFDLTFCQVWYDGRGVYATHPTHIKEHVGYLQKDYVPLYVKGNEFLRRRIRKYSWRGFRILLDPSSGLLFEQMDTAKMYVYGLENNKPGEQPRDDAYFKHWAAHALLHYFVEGSYTPEAEEFNSTILKKATNLQVVDAAHPRHKPRVKASTRALIRGAPVDFSTVDYLHATDGYDSEDLDINNKDTFFPAIAQGFAENKFAQLPGLAGQSDELKFIHLAFILFSRLYSPFPEESFIIKSLYYQPAERRKKGDNRTDYREPDDFSLLFRTKLGDYLNALKPLVTLKEDDPVTLDEADIFYLHEHKEGEGISAESLVQYLDTPDFIARTDKTMLPCYVPECTKHLSMTEIHAIVPPEFYERFASYKPPIPNAPLINSVVDTFGGIEGVEPEKASVTDIFKNVPSRTDNWGNLYHLAMCPYCLEFIKREQGCIYVKHENPGGRYSIPPYCNPKNIVEDLFNKYRTASGGRTIEFCVECGRPSADHRHFNTNTPPGFIRDDHYDACTGGRRREMIARILAVRKTMRENPDMGALELRRACAFAADAAPTDADLLAKAQQILDIEAAKRGAPQMNQVLDGAAPTPIEPPAPPAPEAAVPGNAENEAPIGAVGNVFNANVVENPLAGIAGNVFDGGRRQVGKAYVCEHGYTNGYKEKIQHTRKARNNGVRMTRKKIE